MHKKPWVLLAIILTVALIVSSVGWGAVKFWSAERKNVSAKISSLSIQLQKRIEIAHNIILVASRHLSSDSAVIKALAEDIRTLESGASSEDKATADLLLSQHATAILTALEATEAGIETNFDYDYVKQRFPQDLEYSQEGTISAYRISAEQFNDQLSGSISGNFARILGINPISINMESTEILASPAYFEMQGAVSTPTGMLSDSTREDIDTLNKQLKDTGFHFVLVAQHFLGGNNVKSYAEGLFKVLGLDENTIMLFMAIGEQRYYLVSGSAAKNVLPKDDADTLLASVFRSSFMEYRYDEAVGSLLMAAGSQIAEKSGIKLNKAGLFGTKAEQTAPAAGWWNDLFRGNDSTSQNIDESNPGDTESDGFSFPSIVIIGIVLYVMFGRKKGNRQGGGCGCGPLGWILGAFGIADLFGLRKR